MYTIRDKRIMKSVSVVLALTSIILLIDVAFCSSAVSEEILEEYIRRYLQEYQILFETYENALGNLTEFKFYSDYPYHVKGVISKTHGAAIFFNSSSKEEIEIHTIEKRIEFYVWPVMESWWNSPGEVRIIVGDGATLNFLGDADFEIGLGGSVEVQVGGIIIYENRMILKGSNGEKDWTPQAALLEATNGFLSIARNTALTEAEFKQIEGFSLLKAKAEQIESNVESGMYKDNWRLRWKDEAEFWQIAEKYGVKEELSQRILQEIVEPYLKPEPNIILEYAKWAAILIFAPVMVGLIVAWLTGKWKPKFFRAKRRKLKKRIMCGKVTRIFDSCTLWLSAVPS